LLNRTWRLPPHIPHARNCGRKWRPVVGRDFKRPSGDRHDDSAADLLTARTSRHNFSDTILRPGASRLITASGDRSVTRVPRRLTWRVLP
jgi:hypothetical protein